MNLANDTNNPFAWNAALHDAAKSVEMSINAFFKTSWFTVARKRCDGWKVHIARYFHSIQQGKAPRVPKFVRAAIRATQSVFITINDTSQPKPIPGRHVTHDKPAPRHTRHYFHLGAGR